MRAGNRIPLLAGELSGNRCAIGHVKSDRFLADASVPSQNRVIVTLGRMLNHVATVADLPR
jgi:hypothetical protein